MNQDNRASGDEISLVDLATIFVRRVWLFIGLFCLFVVGGVVYAFMQDELFEYVSLYQIAEVGQDKPVETPAKAIAVIKSQKLPEIKSAYKAEHNVRMPFDTGFSNPENTSLIRVTSEAPRESAEEVKTIHDELLNYLKARHQNLLESARKSLEKRLGSIQRTFDALKETPEAGQAVAEVIQKQVELEGEMAALAPSDVLVVTRESVERVAPSRKLTAALASIVGFIFAFMAVFFAEFVSLVRKAMREQG